MENISVEFHNHNSSFMSGNCGNVLVSTPDHQQIEQLYTLVIYIFLKNCPI